MDIDSNIQIRPASIDNKEFILSLVPRLVEFGPSTWRNGNQMTVIDQQVLSDKLSKPQPETAIFVAQDSSGLPLGFIDLQTGTDYYNHEPHGHIANIIIAREGVGCGIGRLLMEKAEAWARSQGYSQLTLSVFAKNLRAREVYKQLGYGEDIMKYVKELA